MPDIEITDQLGTPAPDVKVDLSRPSSLVNYLKTQLLHLAVFPDFLQIKDMPIGVAAAAKPVRFDAKAQHGFQLGNTKPEIEVTPGGAAAIRINVTRGANLFDDAPFPVAAKVPEQTGYLSVGFNGSLDLGVSGSAGDLTFGFDAAGSVSLAYWKAFPLGLGEPTVGQALGRTMSSFVIPADIGDLEKLGEHDIATVSGTGSLTMSGAVSVTASPNPLASAALPLGVGTVAVKAGATAGLSATFTISGSYQVRARRLDADTIELSILKARGTSFETDLSASAGIQATIRDTDVVSALLGAISVDPTRDRTLLSDLEPAEVEALAGAVRTGVNHSLSASLAAVLSAASDDRAAFQYEIQPAALSSEARRAVERALRGDLTLLTGMEEAARDGVLAPGVRLRNSLFTEMRKRGATLKLNLIGLLNYVSVSELIRKSEVLTDEATGDVTIKETVTGNRISALTKPMERNEALRKAIFQSVLVTTTYRAGKAIASPELACEQTHFVLHQNTGREIIASYLDWFVALNLVSRGDTPGLAAGLTVGGPSTCVLRCSFSDPECEAMFFDSGGNLRAREDYLEIGRQAMRALLDPRLQEIDGLRYRIVDDLWPSALKIGANVNLGPLVGLSVTDVRVQYLIGDVMDIIQWATGMSDAGALVADMRRFVGSADVATLARNVEFQKKRDALQKAMASMVKSSKLRFDDPWGMVSLFWAAGSPQTAYGKIAASKTTLERGKPAAAVLTAGSS